MSTKFAGWLALAALATSGVATASVVEYSGGVATGIDDLVVAGRSYHVDFVFGSYATVFGSAVPTFLDDPAGATAAANALLAALSVEPAAAIGSGSGCCGVLWVPYDADDPASFLATQTGYQDSTGATWQSYLPFFGIQAVDHTAQNWGFAVFSVKAPEPGSMALLGLALVGLGVARRNKKARHRLGDAGPD